MTNEQAIQIATQYQQAGKLEEAERICQELLAQRGGLPAKIAARALHLLGVAHHKRGRPEVAVDLIAKAIALDADWADAYSNRGEALRALGRLEESIAAHRRAVSLAPSEARAHYNLGLALKDNGKFDKAIAAYRQALALNPDYTRAWNNLCNALKEKGLLDEADAAARRAIALQPDYAEAHNNLATVLREKRQYADAAAACRQAIALRPHFAEAYVNLAGALRDQGLYEEAIAAGRQAIALKGELGEAYTTLGALMKETGRLEEAVTLLRKAVSLDPNSADAHYALAICLLVAGEWQEGWREHEWRWLFKDFPAHRWASSKPQWDGSDLSGRTILLYCEQGFGDILQFIRYVPMVANSGGRIIVLCPEDLLRLFAPIANVAQWVSFDAFEKLPPYDVNCPLMSLPLVFGTTVKTIPRRVPYLEADAGDVQRWRERMAGEPAGLKVGLVWAGRPEHKNNHNRSISLSILAPLARVAGVNFYSLQKGEPAAEAKSPPAGIKLVDCTAELNDFAQTAALVANLDLVISVDSAVAHLSGALGKPVWMLSPFVSDWRWLHERDDSPWYPSMRLFRQKAHGQWAEVIERVAGHLAQEASAISSEDRRQDMMANIQPVANPDPITVRQMFDLAVGDHQGGRMHEAEDRCRQILAAHPEHADALHLSGVIAFQCGQYGAAEEIIGRAIALRSNWPQAWSNRGEALRLAGKVEEAIAAHRHAIVLDPRLAPSHYNLGVALKSAGRLHEAIAAYRQAITLNPGYAKAHNNLGNALKEAGKLNDAIAALRRAVALQPDFADAHGNLASALRERGLLDEAIRSSRAAVALRPGDSGRHLLLANLLRDRGLLKESLAACHAAIAIKPDDHDLNQCLGNALMDSRQFDEAIDAYRRAIALKPDHAESHANLGCALTESRRADEAIAILQQAIALKPNLAIAYNNLGNALKEQARLEEALAAYRRAAELAPADAGAHSNVVYTMQFCPEYDAAAISAELRRWNERHAEPLKRFIRPHARTSNAQRRLRIGYVSPDFLGHVVGFNLLPLFENHDRRQFEIICYAQVLRPDSATARFRRHADRWCNIVGLSDAHVAEQIRRDGIDILVDLTLHMSGNRLLVFARKPAPVQVTFAGYPGSTGLSAMDFRLSDPYLDPPGNDSLYTERTIRLPDSFWCYAALACHDVPVNPLPALSAEYGRSGIVTFGCLNNPCKVNAAALKLWAQVMRQVPGSRLILLANEGSHRERTTDFLSGQGIDPGRVEFAPRQHHRSYLEVYHRIDIGLDSVPYNGHTTSLDSLWMGVPVVTLVGQSAIARAGWCQLSNLRLTELASHSPEQFVAKAVALARDLPRLMEIRSTLRNRMETSPLMDAKRFARSVEDAYRQMWKIAFES